MPARTTSYGLGQYRFNRQYSYINQLNNDSKNNQGYQQDLSYCDNVSTGSRYQDIKVTLPTVPSQQSGSQSAIPVVQYGQTYYIELTVPQNPEYETTIDLKLCAMNNGDIDFERFQNIKRIIVPSTPKEDDIYSPVLLFESPETQNNANTEKIVAAVIEQYTNTTSIVKNHLYKYGEEYYYAYNSVSSAQNLFTNTYKVNNKSLNTLPQTWKMISGKTSTVTIKFAFSPKFNLDGGYPYLLIETNRQNPWSDTMQWISDGKTYYGTTLDIKEVSFKLYSVSNLLQNMGSGQAQIVAGASQLTHIGIWGHPELMFTINGEEIKIGQSGYYELKDFTIDSLGVIVTDYDVDRFTIDYEYRTLN